MLSIYQKPKITVTKVKMNTFWKNRSFDSLNTLSFDPKSIFGAAGCTPSYSVSSGTCFPNGTNILMGDGSLKFIEEIKENDMVLSYNLESKTFTKSGVKELIIHSNSDSVYIIINNILRITSDHIMLINNNWQCAELLKLNDVLINQKGQEIKVTSIEKGEKQIQNMYNLELNGEKHNFFAEGILVHNMKSGGGGGGGCFIAGTNILMDNGSRKSIEKVKAGDSITSYNTEMNKTITSKVTELIIHEKPDNGYLIINGILKVTPEHVMYINGQWVGAGTVKTGDTLLNSLGEKIIVESVEKIDESNDKIYNLHLEEPEHNYFAEDILVHNYKI